jgi:hypothetical protein
MPCIYFFCHVLGYSLIQLCITINFCSILIINYSESYYYGNFIYRIRSILTFTRIKGKSLTIKYVNNFKL